MILRDCNTNTSNMTAIRSISDRKWDVLLMKMCEDYDRKRCLLLGYSVLTDVDPWVVLAIKDAGPYVAGEHNCLDTSACGCKLAH